MTHRTSPSGGLTAPRPKAAQTARPGFFARLFGRKSGGQGGDDSAQVLRHSLAQRLPNTDPLRAARLQAHLFLGQLPSFPKPQDAPLAGTPATKSADRDGDDMAGLRAEKQRRESLRQVQQAAVAADPARQRMETLRSRRQQELQGDKAGRGVNRPKNAAMPIRTSARAPSRATQAAAARTPARQALNQVASGQGPALKTRSGGRSGVGFGLNSLLLLTAIVTAALIGVAGWWGYNWYQDQGFGGFGDPLTPVETPSNDIFDDGAAQPSPAVPTGPAVPTVPDTDPDADTDLGDADIMVDEDVDLTQGILDTTTLRLEQKLFSLAFLNDGGAVDGIYDQSTLQAMFEFSSVTANPNLGSEIMAASLRPSLEQIEQWITLLDELL